jgi:hypothetical protein
MKQRPYASIKILSPTISWVFEVNEEFESNKDFTNLSGSTLSAHQIAITTLKYSSIFSGVIFNQVPF